MTDRIEAPFTDQQVKALNRYQREGRMHPFTCAMDHEEHVILVAGPEGWWCPAETCTYTQSWAHGFMADETWMDYGSTLGVFHHELMSSPKPAATTTRREALEQAISAIIAQMQPNDGWSEYNAHMLAAAERVRELDLSIPYPLKPVTGDA